MLLAAAGLVEGRHAITHHGALADLEAAGAHVVRARVVDDGDLVTAGGVTSGLDLALHLVERLFGSDAALAAEREPRVRAPRDGVARQRSFEPRLAPVARS